MEFKIEILEEKKNLLINRKEIKFKVDFFGKGTPNRIEVKKKLSATKTSNEKLTIIVKLRSYFGQSYVIGKAHIYDDIKELQKFEPLHIQIRNLPKEKRAEIYKLRKENAAFSHLFEYQ